MKRELSASLKRTLRSVLLAGTALAISVGVAFAQTPSAQPPFNIDIGAVITNSAAGPGTVNSSQLNNLDKDGAICTFNQTAATGSPTVTFRIQNYDTASGQYYTVANSMGQSITTNTPITIMTRPGLATANLPSGIVSASSLSLSRYWRVQQVLAGGGTTSTGTIGCILVK